MWLWTMFRYCHTHPHTHPLILQDPSLERLHAAMERIGDVPVPPPGQDESAAHWLTKQPGIDATYVVYMLVAVRCM